MRMTRLSLGRFLPWPLYFLALLVGALSIRDIPSDPSLFTTIGNLAHVTNLSDPKTYAVAALDVHRFGWVSEVNAWILSLWPPGLILLEAGIVGLFGIDAPLVLVLQVLACACLAWMLALQRAVLVPFVGNVVASALPLLLFLFPMPRIFLLHPYGVVLGEAFSVAFFLSAGLLLILGAQSRRLSTAMLAGLCFALAAYFRSQYESILMATTGLAVPVLAWCLWRRARQNGLAERASYATTAKVIVVSLLVAHAVMLPWRVHNYAVARNFAWVQTGNVIFLNGLSSDEALIKRGGGFVVEGAGNLACKVEPKYCDRTEKELFLKAFLSHPFAWYRAKFAAAGEYWNTFSFSRHRFTTWFHVQDDLGSLVYFICLIAVPLLLVLTRRYQWWDLMAWSVASLYAASFVIFTLAHFESRYFYLLKIFAFVWSANMSAMVWGMRKKGKPQTAPQCTSPTPC